MMNWIARTVQSIRRRVGDDRGAATVELALTAPIFFAIVFASLEYGRINMIRNTVENSAYEGARHAAVPGASVNDAQAAAQEILDAIQVTGATITVTPNPVSTPSETVTVTVSVPASANGYSNLNFMAGKMIVSSCTLTKELPD